MCSRFELNAAAGGLMARFRLAAPPLVPNRAEVRPTDPALVIGPGGAQLQRWGLAVEWDKRPIINARWETLAAKPIFRRLGRVLVPASAWVEWSAEGKRKHRLGPADGRLFALAGLSDGERFTVVTRGAAPDIAHVHDRMPLVLPEACEQSWLDGVDVATDEEAMAAVAEDEPQGSLF